MKKKNIAEKMESGSCKDAGNTHNVWKYKTKGLMQWSRS